jgi:alpha-mannosidase
MALSFFPSGKGETPLPFVHLKDSAVQVTAIKKAEDGAGIILRLYEPSGQSRTTVLELPFFGVSTEIQLGGFEVRTIRFDPLSRRFDPVNLVEEPLPSTEEKAADKPNKSKKGKYS